MHSCSVDFRALPVCRTFVVLCNKMWLACVLCVAQDPSSNEKSTDPPLRAFRAFGFRPGLTAVQLSMRQIWTALFGT
jgi:hypothetical protein